MFFEVLHCQSSFRVFQAVVLVEGSADLLELWVEASDGILVLPQFVLCPGELVLL